MTGKRIAGYGLGVILTALYAYMVVAAIGNFMGMASFLGEVLSPLAWVTLSAGIVVPIIAFVVSLLLGRRRSGVVKVLLLTAGLSVSAVIQLDLLHLMG